MNRLAILPIAILITATVPLRAASGCDTLVAAALKVLEVPAHLYMTGTSAGGAPRSVETIYLNGVTYNKVGGVWRKSPLPTKELEAGKRESEQKQDSCVAVRDEAVNGEAATLYKVHSHEEQDTVDTQVWISKSKGLPLKQIDDIDVNGGPRGKSRTEIRYEYTGVTAPTVADTKR